MAHANPVGPAPTISTSLRASVLARVLVRGNVAGICSVANVVPGIGNTILCVFLEEKDFNMRLWPTTALYDKDRVTPESTTLTASENLLVR